MILSGKKFSLANITDFDYILEEFEKQVADYIGTRYAIACTSARAALRFSLLALGINVGDQVIVPDFTCQVLPITVFCAGAMPRLCDVDRRNLALSLERLPKPLHQNIKAIIFVHPLGLPVDPSPIVEIAQSKGIAFVDDAAQSLGTSIGGKKAGSWGDVGILTFKKFFDYDLGGAAVTNDKEIATKIRSIRSKYKERSIVASLCSHLLQFSGFKSKKIGKMMVWGENYLYKLLHIKFVKKHFKISGGWFIPDQHVFTLWESGNLPNAIVNQLMTYANSCWHRRKLERSEISFLKFELENIDKYLAHRRRIAKVYDELLEEEGFSKISIPRNSVPSYLRYPILFSDMNRCLRCIESLTQAGFKISYRYKPLHKSPYLNRINIDSTFRDSTYISNHLLPLPIEFDMSIEKAEQIASIVKSTY